MSKTFSTSVDFAAPTESRAKRAGAAQTWIVIATVMFAAILRLAYLDHKSLWLDEAVSVSLARLDWKSLGQTLWLREGNMALYYLLLRPFLFVGQGEWQVRLLSALAGIATVPLMFALGTRLFGRRIGILSAVLFAVNACSVVYSQEARGYSLVVLLVTASTLLFVRAVEQPSYWNWVRYGFIAALSLYAHFFAALIVTAQWLSLAALPGSLIRIRKWTFALALTTVLSLPAIFFILTKNIGQLSWVAKPSLLELYHLALFLSAEGGKAVGNVLLLLSLIALVVAGREAFGIWRSCGRSLESWRYALAFLCLLAPLSLTLLASLRTSLFFHRFLIVCLPAFVLLVALGLSRVRPLAVPVVLYVGLSIVASIASYSRTREEWREATRFVLSQSPPGEPIVFFEPWGRVPFDYYRSRSNANVSLKEISANSFYQLGNQSGGFWIVIYPLPTIDPATRDLESRLNTSFSTGMVRDFRGLRIVHYEPAAH